MPRIIIVTGITLVLILGGLAVFVAGQIELRPDHVATPAESFDKLLPPESLREDLHFMVRTFEANHPDFADVVDEPLWSARLGEVERAFDRPMTRVEAYRVIAPLAALIHDGHTSPRRPTEEWRAYRESGRGLFPLRVQLGSPRPEVDAGETASGVEEGDILIEVNGVPAESLAAFALATESGESEAIRRAYAEKGFFASMWSFGLRPPFTMRLERDGVSRTAVSDGLPYAELRKGPASSTEPHAYRELPGGVGYLAFNDMSSPEPEFRRFLKETFSGIRDAGSANLIIDLRENGGGDSRLGDLLQEYLSDERLPAVERMDVRVTAEIKAYYRTLLPEGFRWIPLHRFVPILGRIEAADPGTTFEFHPEPADPVARRTPNPLRFGGNLYVLIGPRTYSSAAIFAAPLKHYGRARFVGARAGEPLVFYGENYVFDLPRSRLQAQVSHKAFRLAGAAAGRRWLDPDVDTGDDGRSALEAALSEIARGIQ
jgi:hypothetical protein